MAFFVPSEGQKRQRRALILTLLRSTKSSAKSFFIYLRKGTYFFCLWTKFFPEKREENWVLLEVLWTWLSGTQWCVIRLFDPNTGCYGFTPFFFNLKLPLLETQMLFLLGKLRGSFFSLSTASLRFTPTFNWLSKDFQWACVFSNLLL